MLDLFLETQSGSAVAIMILMLLAVGFAVRGRAHKKYGEPVRPVAYFQFAAAIGFSGVVLIDTYLLPSGADGSSLLLGLIALRMFLLPAAVAIAATSLFFWYGYLTGRPNE